VKRAPVQTGFTRTRPTRWVTGWAGQNVHGLSPLGFLFPILNATDWAGSPFNPYGKLNVNTNG
jgi:hypothetical protein